MKTTFLSFFTNLNTKLKAVYAVIIITFTFLLFFAALSATVKSDNSYHQQSTIYEADSVQLTVGDNTSTVTLPYTTKTNYGGEPYTISFTVHPDASDVIFLHTVYTPFKLYVDNDLIYSYGSRDTLPSFLKDAPSNAVEISLPESDKKELNIRIVYEAPKARSSISIYPPMIGTEASVIHYMLFHYGVSFFIATMFIIFGILLSAISFLFTAYEDKSRIFLWAGLLTLPAGIWELCENTFTVYLFESPTITYIASFIAFFSLLIPLFKFSMLIMDMEYSPLMHFILHLFYISLSTALILQFTGILQFSEILFAYHIILPLSLWTLNLRILYEVIKVKPANGKFYLLAVSILSLSTLLELINYYFRFTDKLSSLFQLGLLFYVVMSAFYAARYIRTSFQIHEENIQLQESLHFLEKSIDAQKERNLLLVQHQDEIRKQRHDLRHQLIAMENLLDQQEYDSLKEYMGSLLQAIPASSNTIYCENAVVNATIHYYVTIAKKNGIDINIRAIIPASCPHISDANLCIMVGNLLENGIEACKNVMNQRRFIQFNSRIQGDMLFITMDNSYNGIIHKDNQGYYLSSKRNERGTGLASIKSVAEKHGGAAKFEAKENVFMSNAYVFL